MSDVERDAKFYYNKGTIYNGEGKFGLAIDNYKMSLSLDPDSIETHFNLGVAYINKKEYELAVECFKTVISKSPDEAAAYSNLALTYGKLSQYELAIINYKKVLELSPDDTSAFKDLGDVYTKNKQYDNAIECYQNFLKAHPTSFVVKESLHTAINLKKNAQGITENDNEPKKSPEIKPVHDESSETHETAETFFTNAVNYVKEQNFDLAIENLRKCLRIDSKYPSASDLLNKLFLIKEKLGDTKLQQPNVAAVASVNVAKPDVQPSQPSFIDYRKFNELYTLGVAYYNANNLNMAQENFRKALEVNPNDTSCRDYLSKINL